MATYDPTAFEAAPKELQQELHRAVENFRTIASDVLPDKPATGQQFRDGVRALGQLTSAVRKVVWADWENAANGLIEQIESWAAESKWVTRRELKKISELLIGDYQLERLYLYAEGNLYILEPQARFIPGGLGAFDLSIQPSFYLTSIYRHTDGVWYVHLDVGRGVQGAKTEPLTRESFDQALAELRSLL